MKSACRYDNPVEERQHLQAIHKLAKDLGQREDKVHKLYEEMLIGLKEEARIKDYLTILVSRQVRDSIRGRGAVGN